MLLHLLRIIVVWILALGCSLIIQVNETFSCMWMAVVNCWWRLLSNLILFLELLIVISRLSKFHWWTVVEIKNTLVDTWALRLLLIT